jgi:PAS domain S-box-containing protein
MIAEFLQHAFGSELVKQFVVVSVYPVVGGAAVWVWSSIRKLTAIHSAIIGSGGMTLPDRVTAIEDDLVVLRDGQRVRADFCGGDATFECDQIGNCVYVSRTLADMFGLDAHSMLGNGWLEGMEGAKERSRVANNWRAALNGSMPWLETYRVHNRKTGERFIAKAHTYVSKNRDGKILRMFGVVEKVAPHKLGEAQEDNDGTPYAT